MTLAAQLAHRASAGIPPQITVGVVETDGNEMVVNVSGQRLSALWADPMTVIPGDNVLTIITGGDRGQRMAHVLCKTTSAPRPSDGTVTAVPGGSPTITVSIGEDSFACRYLLGYTPVVGDLVSLVWHGGVPLVLDQVSATISGDPAPSVGVSNPTAKPVTGIERFPATSSGTWSASAGGWSTYYGSNLTQGSWSGNTYTGAWFYGSAPKSKLEGKNITKVRLRYGKRKRMGNYNSSLTLNLYRHTHLSKGGSEPSRTHGPQGVSLGVNAGAGWVDLPISWGTEIITNGGGISIAGGSYGGVAGVGEDPESGLLEIHWSN